MPALLSIPDGGQYAEDPPDGPPTSATEQIINEETGETVLQWTNGDATATTQIGRAASGYPTEPTSIWDSVLPGLTSYEVDGAYFGTYYGQWWVRHTRGGTPSAWVWCDNS